MHLVTTLSCLHLSMFLPFDSLFQTIIYSIVYSIRKHIYINVMLNKAVTVDNLPHTLLTL